MSTSNNNKTAERLPPSPLATAEQMTPSLLASNKLLFSTPVHNHSNTYTPGVDSPHSHPPHHEGMRDQSLSSHPYSGRDSDPNGSMTPMSAPNNKTTKSSLISSNHHSNNSNYIHSQNSNNNYTTSTNNNNHTASTISSPPSHPLHHQGSGGVSSTHYSIKYKEEKVDEILAFSPSPILCKVTGITIIRKIEHWLMYIKYILPVEYMPVYFASNNKAFHLAVLAWQYDNINSQPGAALEYLVMYLNELLPLGEQRYTLNSWKAQTQHYSSDTDRIYQLSIDIDNFLGQ